MKKPLRRHETVETGQRERSTGPGTDVDDLSATPLDRERRKHPRYGLPIKVLLRVPGKEIWGSSSDLSAGGIRVTSQVRLRSGAPVSLNFSFGELCFLKLAGQVTHCNPLNDGASALGIKFCALKDWNVEVLESVIQELRQNDSTLGKSFATLHVSEDHLAVEAADIAREAVRLETTIQPSELHSDSEREGVGRKGRYGSKRMRQFTLNPTWVEDMNQYLDPFRQAIWDSKIVQETSTGELSLAQVRGWSIQFYPFIESFPQFMGTYLAKAPDNASRSFLIDNLRVEKRHADQWIDMALGFGVSRAELFETPILPEVEALTHWMWSISNRGTFVEAVSAANFAIEGVTQGIATRMVRGFARYHGSEGVHLPKKAYYWMEAHAHYDDLHPYEALEIIKVHATTKETQQRVTHAAQRSLEYLFRALEACYWAYAPTPCLTTK